MDEVSLKSAKILIVDDQEQNVLLLEHLLEQAGYTNLKSTTDSSQVVGLCSAMSPDLILLDLHMPDPDGFEVMRLLSPWIEGRWFPILVLTADITPEAKTKALSNGARDFVTKAVRQNRGPASHQEHARSAISPARAAKAEPRLGAARL